MQKGNKLANMNVQYCMLYAC